MKKPLIAFALLFVSIFCFSQDRNSLKAGFTYTIFGSGDMRGINYYNEYNHRINRFLTLAPSFHAGYGSMNAGYLRFTKASFAIDPNLFFSPMRFENSKIRLGIGPSLRFLSDSNPTGHGISLTPNSDYVINPLNYAHPLNYWTIGYTVVLEGEINLSARWNTGIRTSFQNYVSGETVANVGFSVGYRF